MVKKIGRPKKPYDVKEAQLVVLAYARYRFGARMLEVAIRKIYKTCISNNRIYMYLKEWDGTRIKVCVILDDASRMILAGGIMIC